MKSRPQKDNKTGRKLRAVDLFCGAGGSSWGAVEAGVDIVAAFDLSALAGKCHQHNLPSAKFHHGRIEDCDVKRFARQAGKIDIILGSPECTSHSPARGKRAKSDPSRDTAFQLIRFARILKPRWIVIENVVGMRRWKRYPELKFELNKLGYNIHEQVLNAADFGVPQTRRRLFLVCDALKMPTPVVATTTTRKNIRPIIAMDDTYAWTPLRKNGRATATIERAERGIAMLGDRASFLLVYYGSDAAGGWQSIDRPLRTITTVDRFAVIKPSTNGHVMRMLQVPELQSAMGMGTMNLAFGNRRDRIRLIGNAVCPPVMQAVLKQLVK